MSVKEEILRKLETIMKNNTDEIIRSDLDILFQYIQQSKINLPEKKLRTKNSIDPSTQCKAYRADGCRCSRKKKDNEYCGTHIKGRPHGVFNIVELDKQKKMIQVFSVDINGILYWIDDKYNVYDTIAIMENKPHPKIINTCEKIIEGQVAKYRLKN